MVINATKVITWNSDTTYALGLHRILAQILGIWPVNRNIYKSLIQIAIYSLILVSVIVIFIERLVTVGNCGVMTDIIDALSVIATSTLSIMKLILPLIYKDSMFVLVSSAVEDWAYNNPDCKTRDIMLKYAFIGRVVFIAQMVGTYVTVMPLILGNLPNFSTITEAINSTNGLANTSNIIYRRIPIGPNCWISPSMSTHVYLLVFYCLITINLFVLSTACNGGDAFIFGIAMHVCGQLEVLHNSMQSLDGNDDLFLLRKKINCCSYRHRYLLELSNAFEKSFNLILLAQLGANTFLISISGILLLSGLKINDDSIILSAIIRIYMLYFQLYMYSYIGEALSGHIEKLQEAIYNCAWYTMSPPLVKDLSFIIMRNRSPFHLTAGKIYHMNNSNFKNLVKTMFSYFSIMRLMFDA